MKTFLSHEQEQRLNSPLLAKHVKHREQSGRKLSYIEGWHAIAEANRIFGFGAWNRETIEIKCVAERERTIGRSQDAGWGVTYIARVRITVTGEGGHTIIREGCGSGHGIDRDLGQAHESALKEAETDAMKRGLMTFGNPFGLALYDKDQSNVQSAESTKAQFIESVKRQVLSAYDAAELGSWWNSAEQKQARRDFGLDDSEVAQLKQLVIDRRTELSGKEAA